MATTYTAALVTTEFEGINKCLTSKFFTSDEAANKRAGLLDKYRGHLLNRHLLIAEFLREGEAINSWLDNGDISQEIHDTLFQMCKDRMNAPSPAPDDRKKRETPAPDAKTTKQATMAPSAASELSEVSDMSLMLSTYAQMKHLPGLGAITSSILTHGGTRR